MKFKGACYFSALASLLLATSVSAKTFTFRLASEPLTLDWNRAHTPVETYLLMNLMEGLVTFDDGLKIENQLASTYTRSPDGRVYTFKIRKGVKWSDGVALKAQDFVYSWKRLITASTAASYAYLLFDVVNAEKFFKGQIKDFSQVGIKAIDDLTFQVTLTKPVAHWIYIPTFWVTFPLRQDIVEKYGAAWEKPGRMVTVGAYSLEKYEIDSKIVLKANANYYGTRGNIDEAVGLLVKDDSTAMTLYESGKFDFVTDLSSLDLKRFAGKPELKAFPYLKTAYLGFSVNRPAVSNVKLRRAIGMAIDKSKVAGLLYGGQIPATSFVPPLMASHSKKSGLPYDPARAKKELESAGLDLSKPIQLELLIMSRDKSMVMAQFIQGELKKNLGLEVTIQPFDNKTYRAQVALNRYPLFLLSWSADYPDPENFLSLFMSDSGNNRTAWKNPSFDKLVEEARTTLDAKKRDKLYSDAQKILVEDQAPIIPLYYEPNTALVRSTVTGLTLNPLNYLILKKIKIKE
ncbi:MAG: peptide ABC transporter substrate-binding protein [Bdellovibrionales bacterium]|nr:peptide ABC transporter substrate-binding protein [Bdellovibrionales bacterium]